MTPLQYQQLLLIKLSLQKGGISHTGRHLNKPTSKRASYISTITPHSRSSSKKIKQIRSSSHPSQQWTGQHKPSLGKNLSWQPSPSPTNHCHKQTQTIDLINLKNAQEDIRDLLHAAHKVYRQVFSNNLTEGYNGYFGKHICRLSWASSQWPLAHKIPIANYDHDLKGIQQEICNEFTAQGVLKILQKHNITVQSVCPSFLRRKRTVAGKAKHLLTKNNCRLLINFSPINDLIKNIPSPMNKTMSKRKIWHT